MNRRHWSVIRSLIGVLGGGFIGLVLGCYWVVVPILYWQWLHPNDHTAGSLGIMAVCTGPLGGMLGACVGVLIARWTTPED
jgi:hypothetical protein